jgi:lipid A 3-O-deacylase
MTRMSSGLYDLRRAPAVPARQVEFAIMHDERLLQPLVGFVATQTQDSYLYFGVLTDLPLFDPLRIALRFAGWIYHQGRGIDLGYPLEFRSEVEFIWNLDCSNRFGIGLAHLSNGALSGVNPGLEALLLSYYFVH